MECESAEAIKTAAVKGQGLGILYQDHVEAEVRRGQLKIVKASGLRRVETQSFVVYPKDKTLSQNALDFLAMLQEPPQKVEPPTTPTHSVLIGKTKIRGVTL